MYCTCMRCAVTIRGSGLSIRCIRSQLFSCGPHCWGCEPNGYWTGAAEDASLKNMNWQVLQATSHMNTWECYVDIAAVEPLSQDLKTFLGYTFTGCTSSTPNPGLPSIPESFGLGNRSRRCLPAKKNVGGILSGSNLQNSGPVFARWLGKVDP